MTTTKTSTNLILSGSCLFAGGSIYVIFRPLTLNMFRWFDAFGISSLINKYRESLSYVSLNDFVLYSLPDGLWITSYLFIVNTIIPSKHKKELLFWILSLPMISVLSEFMQYYNFIQGRFDIYDVVSYILPLIINLIILKYEKVI
jgi:hypothetical protein